MITVNVTRHTAHVTRHTAHVTRHTAHVTRHTAHVTRHTAHVTWYPSHVTAHIILTPFTDCVQIAQAECEAYICIRGTSDDQSSLATQLTDKKLYMTLLNRLCKLSILSILPAV